jgi:transposase
MSESYNRYDISDELWTLIEPHTIGNKGSWGGNAKDTRKFINAVFWILRTGAAWRDLPSSYGNWNNVNRRFCRWRDKGIWETIFLAIIDEDECEWLLIDASFVKAHKDAHGAVGGSQDIGRSKGGLHPKSILPWMRLVVRSEFLSQQVQSMIVLRLMS